MQPSLALARSKIEIESDPLRVFSMTKLNNSRYEDFFNIDTSSYVYSYRPIKLYLYEHQHYPYYALNPLVRGLLYQDPKFSNATHLFEIATNVENADFFLFPCDLNFFEHKETEVFPLLSHYKGNESRHIFFDDRDQTNPFPSEESICIKVSLRDNDQSKNVFCIPYMDLVDNYYYYFIRERKIEYDVSFLGQKTDRRKKIIETLKATNMKVYVKFINDYFYQKHFEYNDEQPLYTPNHALKRIQLRKDFINVALSSKFVLAIQGYGLNSYRFYEALSLGVPPILISEKCSLPYEDKIDYNSFVLQIDSNDSKIEKKILDYVTNIDADNYDTMCSLCRFHYDTFFTPHKLNYLLHQKLSELFGFAN